MALGLGVMVVGSLLFIPAALSANYIIFLGALFTLGAGLTILQTASNPYVVFIGPVESAAMRISIMGLINKSAGILVPLLFTTLILSDIPSLATQEFSSVDRAELASRLIPPYIIMAIVLSGLIALVKFSSIEEPKIERSEGVVSESIFAYPRVVLGAVALFFYVGIEVIAGDTIGLYAQSLDVENATSLTSYTMVFMVISYIVGATLIPKYLSQRGALIASSLLGILFLLGVIFSSTESHTLSEILWGWSGVATLPNSVAFVALLGLSNALVWPTIWPLALDGLGHLTPKGSALLIMAISGGAILPLAFGQLSEGFDSMQLAYSIGVLCYAFILLFALKFYKISSWR
jgi:glucose/galactose transporter